MFKNPFSKEEDMGGSKKKSSHDEPTQYIPQREESLIQRMQVPRINGSIKKDLEDQIEALEEALAIKKQLLGILKEHGNAIEQFLALYQRAL